MPIRILLADDHAEFRQGLRRALASHPGLEVVGDAASGAEAVRLAAEHRPDVVLLDVRMRPVNGIQAIPHILQASPATAVLMLSMHADRQYVARSLAAGARGYLLKDSLDAVVEAIQAVHEGKPFFSPQVAGFAQVAGAP